MGDSIKALLIICVVAIGLIVIVTVGSVGLNALNGVGKVSQIEMNQQFSVSAETVVDDPELAERVVTLNQGQASSNYVNSEANLNNAKADEKRITANAGANSVYLNALFLFCIVGVVVYAIGSSRR